MAGIHGIDHIEYLAASDFADYYAVGSHPQTRFHKLGHVHTASALNIGTATLHANDVFYLVDLKFG
jgi:hypothetical protein